MLKQKDPINNDNVGWQYWYIHVYALEPVDILRYMILPLNPEAMLW